MAAGVDSDRKGTYRVVDTADVTGMCHAVDREDRMEKYRVVG